MLQLPDQVLEQVDLCRMADIEENPHTSSLREIIITMLHGSPEIRVMIRWQIVEVSENA